jgi:hypothetical protein
MKTPVEKVIESLKELGFPVQKGQAEEWLKEERRTMMEFYNEGYRNKATNSSKLFEDFLETFKSE